MSRSMPLCITLALGALGAACGPATRGAPPQLPRAAAPLVLETADDAVALTTLAQHFRARGWQAAHEPTLGQVALTSAKGKRYGLRAYMGGKGQLDRVVLFKAFLVKPEAKDTPRLRELVAKLTNDVNGVMYQLSGDGAFVCLTWVHFVDALDPDLLDATIDFLEEVALPVAAKKSPELVGLLQ